MGNKPAVAIICDHVQTGLAKIDGKVYVVLRMTCEGQAVSIVLLGTEVARAIGDDMHTLAARPEVSSTNVTFEELARANVFATEEDLRDGDNDDPNVGLDGKKRYLN